MRTNNKLTPTQKVKNKSKYDLEYAKKNVKSITFRLSKNRDLDLLNYIESIENKADWFRNLVLKDMEDKR